VLTFVAVGEGCGPGLRDAHVIMKKIYTASNVFACDILRGILESEGIRSMLKNELGSGMAGYGLPLPGAPSLPWAWPEVWVNDEDFDAASRIASDFDKAQPPAAEEDQPMTE
jgi:hypothetical protein